MSVQNEWDALGAATPGDDPVVEVVFNVLAPFLPDLRGRFPVYELSKEETPNPTEVWELASKIAAAIEERFGDLA